MEEIVDCLNDENKIKRRKALSKLQNFTETENLNINEYNIYEIPLISCLSDASEVNRYRACKILETVLEKGLKPESMLQYIIPILCNRLLCNATVETCEENRLELLKLLEIMLNTFKKDMHIYSNDLCNIFVARLQDKYSEVILKTCDCITKLPNIIDINFQMFSELFVKYLLQCISRNRMKVRIKVLNTLESIYAHGSTHNIKEESTELMKCIHDVHQVRLALLSLGCTLCLKMKERDKYWSIILPFVLFGLRDADAEIQKTAVTFLDEIGIQFAKQNDIKLFDENGTLRGIQTSDIRSFIFNNGCCIMIERNFHLILEDLQVGIKDWQEKVRLISLQILATCLMGLKENCLQFSFKIIDMLRFSVNDHDAKITEECLLCAEILGRFLPPDLYIPLLENSIWEKENEGCMLIFSRLVETTPVQHLQKSICHFSRVLSIQNVGTNISVTKLKLTHKIYQSLVNCNFDNWNIDLFLTYFYVIEKIYNLEEEEKDLKVMKCLSYHSINEVVSNYMRECLSKLTTKTNWIDEDDATLCVFLFLSRFEGFESEPEIIAKILKVNVDHKTAPVVAFRILRALTFVFERTAKRKDKQLLQYWINFVVKGLILEMLQYNSGEIGESLHLASISALVPIVEQSGKQNYYAYQVIEECLPFLEGLLQENYMETRILSCRFIEAYLHNFSNFVDPSIFFNLMRLMVDRLDDGNLKVRRLASSVLCNSFRNYPRAEKVSEEVKYVLKSIAIYVTDDDATLKQNLLELSSILGEICPAITKQDVTGEEFAEILMEIQNLKTDQKVPKGS